MLAKGCERWLSAIFVLFAALLLASLAFHLPVLIALSVLAFLLFIFFLLFFRDPERHGEICETHMLSPADGRIVDIRGRKLCIFMNITDVHVNRSPLPGKVLSVRHVAGSYLPAFTKDSDRNERFITLLDTPHGIVELTQIAGTGVRRIRPYIECGDSVTQNQRVGTILFGSRVDVTVPESFCIEVKKWQKVKAGETIIAKISTSDSYSDISVSENHSNHSEISVNTNEYISL
ncbi:Phosphatidylserine decarboxylase proenzyme [Methanosarcinaceae archaeon Ag5]|uniref:Phosphatidylserine decarboxylase proenzyme n=1 Tax=Methanolapillus africanus TaxID=3028297 RepID=A0AAE4SFR2_9EURY|nr:Phosphatidylserine decarboxylase proenzyme [Methanosarcinaceae archaeon Ag5]